MLLTILEALILLPKDKYEKTTVLTIISITKTKILHKTKLFFCNNNLYTYYWANSNSSIERTAIMIQNHLKFHVYSCFTYSSSAIALDLFFKSNIKLHIISVYLFSTDSTKYNLTQNTVITEFCKQ